MKIIHCADIHLDSPLNSNLDFEKAKIRKNEILISFGNMIDYAKNNNVNIVIIAGDLFDSENISKASEKYVFDKISTAEDIDFLYLIGNHDLNVEFKENLPKNFKIIEDEFSCYNYDNVCIKGLPLGSENYNAVDFESEKYNVLVAHGTHNNPSDEYYVNLKSLQNKNIDYLALGHIHKQEIGKIDDRGVFAQSGCLDGRGFDECGEKGYMLVDTDAKTVEFISASSRVVYEIEVDISSATSTYGIIELITKQLENIPQKSIVRALLCGKTDSALVVDEELIKSSFKEQFFSFSLKNKSTVFVDYNAYSKDISLKGEFIRLCEKSEMDENERIKVISTVINALNSEELGI